MPIDRYHRQWLLPQIGREGQERIGKSKVLLIGCGALGGVIAEQLVRAGIGMLRIVDRDLVELTNLQRQVLFDEDDVRQQLPKAIAAARRLGRINSEVVIQPFVKDLHASNAEELAGIESDSKRVDLILDGTDNVETRYLLNDLAVKHGIPWVYGACVGTEGRRMAVVPGITACLRCVFPNPPSGSELPTCDTAGVLGPAAAVVASLQVTAALQILTHSPASAALPLITVDLWNNRFKSISLEDAKREDCPTCRRRNFEFLERPFETRSTQLCGRNAVQVSVRREIQLDGLAAKLTPVGTVQQTPFLLRCELQEPKELSLTIFPDGRAIIQGTSDLDRARSIYARFIGN